MKLLITGASGFLGRRTAAHFAALGFQVLTPSHGQLDIIDETALRNWFRENRPDAVIHTAAISDTGLCQKEPEWSETVNVDGCVHLAKACREVGAKLLICSSDQVYSGSPLPGPHQEAETVNPNNVYGNQKLRAEQKCLEILPETVCLRLSWMYSAKPFPGERRNFFTNLKEALEDSTKPLTWPVQDRRGITDVDEVVKNLTSALNLPGGVYNFGSEDPVSPYETVKSVLEKLGMEEALSRLTPNEEAFAQNPRDISMDLSKLRSFGITFPTTEERLLTVLQKGGKSMTLYICLDDRNGLQFNKRRQSRDSAVLEDIRNQLTGSLLIEAFSEKLIREAEIPYVLTPETAEDYFAEDIPAQEVLENTSKMVIYRWNRHYPSDIRWAPDLESLGFALLETTEFPGTSHEKITREVYVR